MLSKKTLQALDGSIHPLLQRQVTAHLARPGGKAGLQKGRESSGKPVRIRPRKAQWRRARTKSVNAPAPEKLVAEAGAD